MDTSIYISNTKIQFVCGEEKKSGISVSAFKTVELPEETIINGVIVNEGRFDEAFQKITEVHPAPGGMNKVRLTIGSGQALVKAKKIPKMSEDKVLQWMKGEFAEGESEDEEYLYDYEIMDIRKDGDIALLCAIKKSMLDSYVRIFRDAGISLSCIDIGLNSQAKLIHKMPATEGKTFLVLTIDGNMMDTVLYINGLFAVSNRSRILSERGSSDLGEEVARTVSAMIQFNHAQKNEQSIDSIYMCGFRPDEDTVKEYVYGTYSLVLRNFKDDADIIEVYDQDFYPDDYIYAVGNLIRE